ncbi:NAD(P)H-dependent glycerol-3-phosphate dehydrogenase [Yoonia sediminilitoris]|uniref:Glycerol-3-phosphate dehydrogenase [NAD(P)+] n=1 Tax=Yoonia sediminilitoris TaxID=1286148 RepID=A0A2T6KMS9_9RHOB|nr:NAD(P)H-dependent glycerol-3-phosphate dehydrogenase [Yoonia sediminilitoris]PUB17525.1 glycerol-3-phosphate dehydrogenase (NAD(P)+) [Yoonia sediminilitoris]RCW97820.1 glycerol-3-phosphate dehydrogenase (NAD(P)+) [Yoonia sediminilitoris]
MKHRHFDGGPVPSPVQPFQRPAVIGIGSWGTALAATLADDGTNVRIWGRNTAAISDINRNHRNDSYVPDAPLPPSLCAVRKMEDAVKGADVVLIVVPSSAVRSVSRQVGEYLESGVPVAVCAKGIEAETGLLMTQIAEEELRGHPIGCVSGPTFARETILRHPTAATVAFPFSPLDRLAPNESSAVRLAVTLTTEHFRAYVSDDLVGVEIGGAVKNVIALACGMLTGAGFADNSRAALITRGLDEMKLLGNALGGRRETLTGLSGIGDLTLTCNSPTSRNMSLGMQLGAGTPRAECFDGRPVVVEGEANAVSITDLARKIGVNMPICETVRAILHDGADLGQSFAALWARPIEAEPLSMDLAFAHPATDKDIAALAERIS